MTAVCATPNVELVRGPGPDKVVGYLRIAEAYRYVETHQKIGNVVVLMGERS